MTTLSLIDRAGLDRDEARRQLARGLEGADDGALSLDEPAFESKVRLLETIDAHARAKDPRVRQVSVSFGASWQVVEILRGDGESYRDVRPLVRVNVSVVAGEGDRQESASYGYGGRE